MMKTDLLRPPAARTLDVLTLLGMSGGVGLLLCGVFFPGAQALPILGLGLLFPSLMYALR